MAKFDLKLRLGNRVRRDGSSELRGIYVVRVGILGGGLYPVTGSDSTLLFRSRLKSPCRCCVEINGADEVLYFATQDTSLGARNWSSPPLASERVGTQTTLAGMELEPRTP